MSTRSSVPVPVDVMGRRHYDHLAWVLSRLGRPDNSYTQDFITELARLNVNMNVKKFQEAVCVYYDDKD